MTPRALLSLPQECLDLIVHSVRGDALTRAHCLTNIYGASIEHFGPAALSAAAALVEEHMGSTSETLSFSVSGAARG